MADLVRANVPMHQARAGVGIDDVSLQNQVVVAVPNQVAAVPPAVPPAPLAVPPHVPRRRRSQPLRQLPVREFMTQVTCAANPHLVVPDVNSSEQQFYDWNRAFRATQIHFEALWTTVAKEIRCGRRANFGPGIMSSSRDGPVKCGCHGSAYPSAPKPKH